MRLIRVAVPVPSLEALTYLLPDELAEPAIGARVLVPLGNRTLTGIAVEIVSGSGMRDRELTQPGSGIQVPGSDEEPGSGIRDSRSGEEPGSTERSAPGIRIPDPDLAKLPDPDTAEPPDPGSRIADPGFKPILDVLDAEAFLPRDVVTLASWVAEYYACGAGEAMASAMPPRAWIESERHAQITGPGTERRPVEKGIRRQILDALEEGKPVRFDSLLASSGQRAARGSHAALLGLERDGLVQITRPLKGTASAYRTVRVAALTAQGHDVVSRDQAGLKAGTTPGPGAPVATADDPSAFRPATPDDDPIVAAPDDPDVAPAFRPATRDDGPRLGARQREALELLKGAPDGLETSVLADRGIAAPTLTRLSSLGLIAISRRRVERDPFTQGASLPPEPRAAFALTDEQTAAFDATACARRRRGVPDRRCCTA